MFAFLLLIFLSGCAQALPVAGARAPHSGHFCGRVRAVGRAGAVAAVRGLECEAPFADNI